MSFFQRESIIILKKNILVFKNESIIFVECIILSGRKYYFYEESFILFSESIIFWKKVLLFSSESIIFLKKVLFFSESITFLKKVLFFSESIIFCKSIIFVKSNNSVLARHTVGSSFLLICIWNLKLSYFAYLFFALKAAKISQRFRKSWLLHAALRW